VRPGDTYRFTVPRYHFGIIVAECPHDNILLVQLTKPLPFKDQTCTVTVAEFPDLAYDSLVAYWDAGVATRAAADTLMTNGFLEAKTPVAEPVVNRIIAGIPLSDAVARVKCFVGPTCCP
jgi:hypothetical protein